MSVSLSDATVCCGYFPIQGPDFKQFFSHAGLCVIIEMLGGVAMLSRGWVSGMLLGQGCPHYMQ